MTCKDLCVVNQELSQFLLYPHSKVNTLQPLYNTVCYNTVLDTQFKGGSQKCIDYIEK